MNGRPQRNAEHAPLMFMPDNTRPLIVLAHGAGAGQSHPFMTRWRERLAAGANVHAFEYDYMAAGSRRPDRLPQLMERHLAAVHQARTSHPDGPLILVGKSMGSRVGCHLAVDHPELGIAGLVCFGYPLVGASKRRPVRDQVLLALKTPVLFIQGTRDKLCPLDHLATVRSQMTAETQLHVVDTGDHSLAITKTHTKQTGITQDQADDAMQRAIGTFLESLR